MGVAEQGAVDAELWEFNKHKVHDVKVQRRNLEAEFLAAPEIRTLELSVGADFGSRTRR